MNIQVNGLSGITPTPTVNPANSAAQAPAKEHSRSSGPGLVEIKRLQNEIFVLGARMRKLSQQFLSSQITEFYNKDSDNVAVSNMALNNLAQNSKFSAETISDKIFETAVTLASNDKIKLKALSTEIEKGFGEVKQTFRFNLPDLTKQTMNQTVEKFEDYLNKNPYFIKA